MIGCSGTETPDGAPPQLYTVLEQKETSVGTSLYGSGHEYVVPSDAVRTEPTATTATGRVRRRFEDAAPGNASAAPSEAPSDATTTGDDDEAGRKKKKAKAEKSKKHKDFKF